MPRLLTPDEIDDELQRLPGWRCEDGTRIVKRYDFSDFVGALAFVNLVGAAAEEADHHPDLTLGWGYAQVSVHTHSAGGVTAKDVQLAAACERAYDEGGTSA